MIIFAGIGFWVVGFPATLIMRSTPEDYGLLPDGEATSEQNSKLTKDVKKNNDKSVKEIIKSATFWKFAIATSLTQGLFALNLLHIPALTSFSVSLSLAGFSIAIIAFADVTSRLMIGFSSNKINPKYLMSIAFLLLGLGSLSLSIIEKEIFGIIINTTAIIIKNALCWGRG